MKAEENVRATRDACNKALREGDASSFVDDFMKMKNAGHVRIYTLEELKGIFASGDLTLIGNTLNQMSFPRDLDERYRRLLEKTESRIRALYDVHMVGEEARITLPVNNAAFETTSD